MIKDPLPTLQPRTYGRWMRLAERVARVVGLKLQVRGFTSHLQEGEIFLFNHFTRIETCIPPLLLWQQTGGFARSVTHHGLYHVHPWLRRFLLDTGCVPSDLPDLLPYLAAEILRGRKVVIFPEGGLIKDKRIFDDRGNYAVRGADNRGPRPHHRGAAVLAVYLDIFKAHIRDANTRGDTATLTHWVQELSLPGVPALLAACTHPTKVVPSTLTFFPIRSESNLLVRAIESVFGELPERTRDEVIMETNLLLRPTDLALYVGRVLPTAWDPPKAEAMLWRHALRNVTTMAQLFALELDHAQWLHGPLAHRTLNAVTTQRDRATRALYGGLTVNLHHVVATLIADYHAAGHDDLPETVFDEAVFWAVYRLQEQAQHNPSLPLEQSLAEPATLLALAQGTHHPYSRFLAMLRNARLVKRGGGRMRLSQRLDDAVGPHEIRLENPVRLHVNEAASQPAIRLAAMWATQQSGQPGLRHEWADVVLQTERTLAQARTTAAADQALPAGITATQPFCLKPHASKDQPQKTHTVGVLMLHGLGATPAQSRPLAEELQALGYGVHALCLPGHGGQPADMFPINATDWVAAARLGLQVLRAQGYTKLVLVGFSTGALVALQVARKAPEGVVGVVAVAPALRLVSPWRLLLPVGEAINLLAKITLGWAIPQWRHGIIPFYPMKPSHPAEQYAQVPVRTLGVLQGLARRVRRLNRLPMPVYILHGTADRVADYATSAHWVAKLTSPATMVTLPDASHDVFRTNTANSWAHAIQAVQQLLKRTQEGSDHA